MQWMKLKYVTVGVLIGACSALVVGYVLDSDETLNRELASASDALPTESVSSAVVLSSSAREVSAEVGGRELNSVVDETGAPDPQLTERLRPRVKPAKPMSEQYRDALLSGGFSKDRSDYLIQRAEELSARSQQQLFELRSKGLPVELGHLKYTESPDLDLRKEIGDDEYTRYLKALGRMTGVEVVGIPAGSNAATGGLMPGDEIVTYGGERVYNGFQLNELAARGRAGQSTAVEVLRDGGVIWLSLTNGPTGIQAKTSAQKTQDGLRNAEQNMINEILKHGRRWAEMDVVPQFK